MEAAAAGREALEVGGDVHAAVRSILKNPSPVSYTSYQ